MSGANEPGAGLSSTRLAPTTRADGLSQKDAAMANKSMKLVEAQMKQTNETHEASRLRVRNRMLPTTIGLALALLLAPAASAQSDKDLAQEIFDTMVKLPGNKPGYRLVHAKGIVCKGTFTPSNEAPAISRAEHFRGAAVPATVRFSDAAPSPTIPDISPDSAPRGMAIRFSPPGSKERLCCRYW
jgi:hypothetical protein